MDANNKPNMLNDPALAYAAEPGVERISIRLNDHFQNFAQSLVESGRYSSASEVVCDGLRMVEAREAAIRRLDDAIDIGLASGEARPFDMASFLAAKRASVSEAAE